jgi:hypothetical protein
MLRRFALAVSLLSSCIAVVLAQSADIPLADWAVPTYRASSASGGLTTMADVTPGVGFVGIQPCRVADTRGNGAPIQGGIFANSAQRTWDLTGLCGLPAGTDAISANFTVVAAGGIPAGSFLLAWPTGQAPPPTAIMTYGPGQIISNAAIVPLGPGEQLNVNVSGSTHIVMDVNGYFTDQYNSGNQFRVNASVAAGGAILGVNSSAVDLSAGVRGDSSPTTGRTFGVWGETASSGLLGAGVVGVASAASGLSVGTWGQTLSATDGAIGVFGDAPRTTGRTYGVWGQTSSTDSVVGAAGVFGVDADGVTFGHSFAGRAGVRGESRFFSGVKGLTENGIGVRGSVMASDGIPFASGYLGYFFDIGSYYGVYSQGNAHVQGTFTASMKSFVQPHPTDPTKEIRYVSLEGPNSEVYFRGTAQIEQGVTRIPVPDYFRMVASPHSYSTLVTPVGGMASVAVLSEGEDGIVVEASRNVRIHYVVYAEREAAPQSSPIVPNVNFRPAPERDLLADQPEGFRTLLIRNGTLNPDGTVNMETARRLGWDKEWEKRGRPTPQPSED